MNYEVTKFKGYIKLFGWTGLKMSKFMGLDYTYYRKRTQNKRNKEPLWLRMFNKGWEMRDSLGCDCEKNSVEPTADSRNGVSK